MAMQLMGEELLTPGGVAALLFVDRAHVLRWVASGRLPSTRTTAGHLRILRSDIEIVRANAYQRLDLAREMQRDLSWPDHEPCVSATPGQAQVGDALQRSIVASGESQSAAPVT